MTQLSSYEWDDGGKAAGEAFAWIAHDATSSDRQTSTRAGQSAHTLAKYLADHRDELSQLHAGWFGLQRRSIGELNPQLLLGFANALTPFQGAMVGDFGGVNGFDPIGGTYTGGFQNPWRIFAVMNTDTDAAKQFTAAAEQRVHTYLRQFARTSATNRADTDGVTLAYAGSLAGVMAGGNAEISNPAIDVKTSKHWVNWLNYEIAVAHRAGPGDLELGDDFFNPDGTLKTPDEVSPLQLVALSNALDIYVSKIGLGSWGRDLRADYGDASGR